MWLYDLRLPCLSILDTKVSAMNPLARPSGHGDGISVTVPSGRCRKSCLLLLLQNDATTYSSS